MENCDPFVFTITFVFHQLLQVALFQLREATFFLLFFVFLLYLCSFKYRLNHRNFYPYVKIWFFSLSMLRGKIIFTKNQKQNNRHCVTCYVISMYYTLIGHSLRGRRSKGKEKGIEGASFLPRALKFTLPLPLLTPATQATQAIALDQSTREDSLSSCKK